MANELSQEAGKLSREDLFPQGWEEKVGKLPPEAVDEEYVPPQEGEDEVLAEARDKQQETQEHEQESEGTLGRMRLNDFLNAAGVTMEEFGISKHIGMRLTAADADEIANGKGLAPAAEPAETDG